MIKQVDKSHYNWSEYVTKVRWISYWYQLHEVYKLNPKSVLIVGAGDNIACDILRKTIDNVKVVDIDQELNPDYLVSVTDLSAVVDEKFDVVLCCQVLEHLPFEHLEKCIGELRKVSNKHLIISLPQKYYHFEFAFTLFSVKFFKKTFTANIEKKHRRFIVPNANGHYWEVGVKGVSTKKIRSIFQNHLDIQQEYTVKENPYHRFYVMNIK